MGQAVWTVGQFYFCSPPLCVCEGKTLIYAYVYEYICSFLYSDTSFEIFIQYKNNKIIKLCLPNVVFPLKLSIYKILFMAAGAEVVGDVVEIVVEGVVGVSINELVFLLLVSY